MKNSEKRTLSVTSDGRSMWVDILRAILIITVVVGHSNVDTRIIQIIFWFHMPLFFILSGYLLHVPEKNEWKIWGMRKAIRLLVPCFAFFILCTLIDGNLNFSSVACFVMGGKRQAGVYWFATVLFLAEIAMVLLELYISSRKLKIFIYVICFAMAVMESVFLIPADTAMIPNWLKLPWNIDVTLLAVAYLAVGYYGRGYITGWAKERNMAYRAITIVISVIIFGLFLNACWKGNFDYHLDMKNGHYSNPVFALLFPAAAGIMLMALSILLSRVRGLAAALAYVGRASMAVMYLHLLVIGQIMKRVYGEEYPVLLCVVVVLAISCAFNYAVSKNKWLSLVFLGSSGKR